MVRRLLFLSLFYLCLFLAACKTAVPTPTATAVAQLPTTTATHTATAVLPTQTHTPAATPAPTRTPRVTATPLTDEGLPVGTIEPVTAVTNTPRAVNSPTPILTANLTASLVQSGSSITGIVLNQQVELTSTLQSLVVEPTIAGEWQIEWKDSRTVLTLDPAPTLPGDTTYTFTFADPLFAADGRLLHTPLPLTLTTPSIVTEVWPEQQEWHSDYTSPETDIEIAFRREMDQISVENAFQINPPIDGEFIWENNRLIFHPNRGFLDGFNTYTVSIQPDAQDAAGNPAFSAPYSWSFTTGELYTDADFGNGYKVQVVDAEGRRAVQYRSYETQPITPTFALYDLNQEQVMNSIANFAYLNYRFDLSDAPLVITWTAVTSPTEVETDSEGYYLNPQEVILPTDVPPGPYVLVMETGDYQDQLLILFSQNTLAVKRAGSQIMAWATNINGTAVPNLEMSVWDDKGREVVNGRTDGSGVFQTTLTPGVNPAFVLARSGDDLVISGFDNHWGPQHRYFTPPAAYLAHITTDRPIYRPGHTVYFKAIVRSNNDAALAPLPEGTAVTTYLRDARGNLVETLTLTANHFGTVHGQFQLADGAMLGEYRVEVSLPQGGAASQRFKVEDYRKPDYEVTVVTDADRYLVGDTVSVTVDSAYFFGEPVVNADVQVYVFGNNWGEWSTYDEPVTGQTDGNGRFTFTLTPGGGNYAIEATVDDGSHQSVSGFHNITVHSQAETMWLHVGNYRKEPNTSVSVQVDVKDIFGVPVANRAVTMQLHHYSPDSYDYVEVESFNGTTDANGRYTFTFTPAELGHYRLVANATDRLGNAISVTRHFMVYNPTDRYSRWYGRSDALTITGSQESYVPGETGQLFIQSTFAGPALLTIERATVLRQQLIELTPPLTVIDIPIEAGDTPNIFANVMAWQPRDTAVLGENSLPDSQLTFAEIQLPISLAQKILQITISPDKTQYGPGEEATVTLRVTNSLGDPVSAELSLAVVDEAIFSLSPELVGPMMDAFYFKRPNQVNIYNSMHPRRSLWYVGYSGGGMGGGGGDDEPLSGQPRRDFQDTAAWFPTLQTDANGEVTVTFTLPDNLTSWRLTAKAVTADTQVGETTHNITTWKPVIVRPILPRTLTAGDEVELSAIVHNNDSATRDLYVTLAISPSETSPLSIITGSAGNLAVPITLKPGETRVIGWTVVAHTAGVTQITTRVFTDTVDPLLLDAVELPLTIRPLAIPNVTTQIGQFEDNFATDIVWPEDALDISTLQIELNRSIAGSMVNGLEYLTGYPYGCVEQTMSRALPNAVVARAFQQLGVSNPALLTNLEPLVQASVQRLYGFQHQDGGWGWWTDDDSHDYQTAWVIFGLATTADAGYAVDPAVIERGAAWLNIHLADMDVRTRAYALYALAIAGHGNHAVTVAQTNRTAGLDTFSLAALALALHELGESAMARQLVDELAETATAANGLVYWPGEVHDGYYHQKTMASTTRNTALALSAFAQIRPGHELEPGMVRYLMNQRQPAGWGSTNETAFAILALTDHLLALQEGAGTAVTTYTVYLNGQTVVTGTLSPDMLAAHVELPHSAMRPGTNELTIEHEGLLYYVINGRVYQPETEIAAAGGVQVTRTYLDGVTGEVVTAVVPNQLIKVQLTVNMPTAASYIIVEDSLPGGLEPLNENLDTTTLLASQDTRPYWERVGYNHKEVRGDQVSFFITDMTAGSHTFTYYARATHVGEFIAMPAEVYAMYDLSVWGRSASRPLLIQPE